MSSAFHLKIDSQHKYRTKKLNNIYDHSQKNWSKHLPVAEFALNNQVYSMMRYSPFYLLYGYYPLLHCATNPYTTIPAANSQLQELHQIQQDTQAALKVTANKMKFFDDKYIQQTPKCSVGQKVWLDTSNFSYKQLGPFIIK